MSNNRQYIGKAKEGNFGTLRISIKMTNAEQFIREHKDEKYLNFYVSKMQGIDKYGNSHTAYCLTPAEQAQAAAPEEQDPQPKGKKKKTA